MKPSQFKGLKMGLLNINSLKRHINKLLIVAHDFALDILAINEIKLDDSYCDCLFSIEGYNLIRLGTRMILTIINLFQPSVAITFEKVVHVHVRYLNQN